MRTVISGASGRMGRALLRELSGFPALHLSAALVSAGSASLGTDSGELAGLPANGIACSADRSAALRDAGLAIDFSSANASLQLLQSCGASGVPLLIGTTGLDPASESALLEACRRIPVMVAANTSIGVALLLGLVRQAAASLPDAFDIEVLETHHRQKRDAPSGTALALAEAAGEGRGQAPAQALAGAAAGRQGPRPAGQIGFAVLRGGDVVGDHEVRFLGQGEQLVLGHRATDRAIFARGALQAGSWLARQPPGRYQMRDFLGLN